MKRYKSSLLSTNARAEIFEEAKANGVIIECRKTNGKVIDELVMHTKETNDKLLQFAAKAIQQGVIVDDPISGNSTTIITEDTIEITTETNDEFPFKGKL